ncbi:hypothetical protein [Roseateles flavus]|uniref:DUF4123 domain-containing protein n=1 Tax=Roseateles flavus TaxID=3149041 RepID=A0ABV0GBI3_9BURK
MNVAVTAPSRGTPEIGAGVWDLLATQRWRVHRLVVSAPQDPLLWVTEQMYIEPESWIRWSVESLCQQLDSSSVLVIEGVDATNWDVWRVFLKEFEVASRQRPSDDRPLFLVVVRGVAQKCLHLSGAALEVRQWIDVLGEYDTLIYVDQLLRSSRKPPKHHKLMVRQISALALWDLGLAEYLAAQPESILFDVDAVLKAARAALDNNAMLKDEAWEVGGSDQVDGARMTHPFVLVEKGDPERELWRRLWTAQAAELLPMIEVRRRELLKGLERHLVCPFDLGGIQVRSLDELEIGRLAFAAQKQGLRGELRTRAEWLADCRNKLAHLTALNDVDALDARMYG